MTGSNGEVVFPRNSVEGVRLFELKSGEGEKKSGRNASFRKPLKGSLLGKF